VWSAWRRFWPGNLSFVKRVAFVLLALILVAIVGSACSTTKVAAPVRDTHTRGGCPADEVGDTCSTEHEVHVAATTTTTVPPVATSTTNGVSQVGNGPLVAPCVDTGSAPQFEPNTIVMACATGEVNVDDIVWSDWNEAIDGGPRQADGTGVFNWDHCLPNCAQGQESSQQVTVTLSNPVSYHGATVWGTLEIDTSAGNLPGYLSTPYENGNVSQLLFALPDFGAP
jgi:hypothetical protein